jgi:hypothetical protein
MATPDLAWLPMQPDTIAKSYFEARAQARASFLAGDSPFSKAPRNLVPPQETEHGNEVLEKGPEANGTYLSGMPHFSSFPRKRESSASCCFQVA